MPRFASSAILICLVATTAAFAQAGLPLGGYYRPGRCIPISIESSRQSIRISAEGAIPTDVQPFEHGRIVPFLILSPSVQSIKIGNRDIPIRALAPNEKLVAAESNIDVEAASLLFPGQTVIPVAMNPTLHPSRAWEALDAIILTESMSSEQIGAAMANGTILAIRSANRPDGEWPWRQLGEFWILRPTIAGPLGAIGGEAAYLPIQAWHVEQPELFRQNIVLAGVAATLLMLATLLIRNRRNSIVTMVVVALLCSGSFAAWRQARQAYEVQVGVVEVLREGIQQNDMWQYLAADASGADVQSEIEDRPIVLNVDHAAFLHLTLEVHSDGSLQWSYRLPPYARLALLNRIDWPATQREALSSIPQSPLRDMVRQSYLTNGTQILGEHAPIQKFRVPYWPTVVVGEE